jgi:hypothetical protein
MEGFRVRDLGFRKNLLGQGRQESDGGEALKEA